jgi:transcriptional regulator with XRE-family HTH domain
LGRRARDARRRRRWTQAQLGNRLGLSQSEVSRLELGDGDGAPIRVWLALAAALDLRSTFEYTRDWRDEPDDAGHLAIQELLLRLARAIGALGSFELRVGRTDPAHSIDVCLRDDSRRRLIVEEAWNTIVDIGAAARSFHRKLEAAADVAVAIGGERPYAVHGVWVVRATRRNRALVARYPEVFERHLPGSSRRWVDALMAAGEPPAEPGLVWCDPAATRLFAWRRYSTTTPVRSSVGSG